MSKKADEIIKSLEEMQWEDIYDNETVRLSKSIPPASENKKLFYNHLWCMKHISKEDSVLEVGCGIGYFAGLCKDDVKSYEGVDVSQESIRICEEQFPELTFKKMYAEKLEYPDNSFGVVVCNQVLEHLKEPEIALKEMIRVTKPNGIVLITVPIGHSLDGKTYSDGTNSSKHINHWGLYELIKLFEQFGDDFKIFYINKFKKTVDGKPAPKNVFAVKFIKKEV